VVEERLGALYEAGRQAWPDVPLPRAAFLARAARCVPDEAAAATVRADDLYLAFACAEREPRALAAFDQRFLQRVPVFLAQLRRPKEFVDDVIQLLREKLFVAERARIEDYTGRGSLEGWLRVAAMRQALDLVDAERRHTPSAELPDDEAFAVTADPELAYIRQRYLPHFREAFARAMRALLPEERNLLRFYLVDGLNIAQIGALFSKSRATIGRMIVETRAKILEETREALAAALNVEDKDLGSLLRVLQSHLDVSIAKLLETRES
jgi:RNA polymerase sigma-70 factor (ECF subfamily)